MFFLSLSSPFLTFMFLYNNNLLRDEFVLVLPFFFPSLHCKLEGRPLVTDFTEWKTEAT